jgi:7-carboxy-7-deazaguanine synthase
MILPSSQNAPSLVVSEQFYSIQGEGLTLGIPAIFLRLAACNLNCSGFSYQDPLTKEHLGCDSKAVWRQGKRWSTHDILSHWDENGFLQALKNGAHLVITGGEPTLQQSKIIPFLKILDGKIENLVFTEIETNATRLLNSVLLKRLHQINASPKLSLSGETKTDRYHPQVIKQFLSHPNASFKFVVTQEKDFIEIEEDFIKALDVPRKKILIMPEGGTRDILQKKASVLIEACKNHGFRYTPRLQIDVWNEVTGV